MQSQWRTVKNKIDQKLAPQMRNRVNRRLELGAKMVNTNQLRNDVNSRTPASTIKFKIPAPLGPTRNANRLGIRKILFADAVVKKITVTVLNMRGVLGNNFWKQPKKQQQRKRQQQKNQQQQ
jgi:hypothetical protein